MSKFKVGDKVKRVSEQESFVEIFGGDSGVVTKVLNCGSIQVSGTGGFWDAQFFIINKEIWSIYSNTLPLSELSDEQRGLLVNNIFNGGDTQLFNGEVWLDMVSGFTLINREFIYRAKQKSERELFIEAALSAAKPFSMDVGIVKAIAEDMFNAGFKAPNGGKNV